MAKYNGHKNWNFWNVSLWINNDEYLYSIARNCVRCCPKARESAARHMLQRLKDEGITQTPDGAPYSVSSIRDAMVGM
jgi:hypothetical protein